jgi:excinuclease UvrABC ATPase subunit
MDGPDKGAVYSTQFLPEDDTAGQIGVALDDPHVGDCRSPSGRCKFCGGPGRLPAYPIDLIIADGNRSITDDRFWHPAVLPAIRSLRRSRIIPEAKFFSAQGVADFMQPFNRMSERGAFLFEHGIPWRRFLKPTARRTDRTQDYFAWRGLHDYVYIILGKIEEGHKKRLKDGFEQKVCLRCQGTGAGWEATYLYRNGKSFIDLLGKYTLASASKTFLINTPAIAAALKLRLGRLKLCDRCADLPDEGRRKLVFASVCAAPLENLALIVTDSNQPDARQLSTLLTKQGMSLGATARLKEVV